MTSSASPAAAVTPAAPPDQATLEDWAVRFLNAMLDSRGELGTDFWTRARTALEASASTASFGEMTSKCAAKLECHGALSAESGAVVAGLAVPLSDPGAFGALAELCRRDAVFIAALARIARDERKEAAKARKADRAAVPASAIPGEPEF
jgi:hypothetical protein